MTFAKAGRAWIQRECVCYALSFGGKMGTKLKAIWIENCDDGEHDAIRIDWSNNRHQRIMIDGDNPDDVILALEVLALSIKTELAKRTI